MTKLTLTLFVKKKKIIHHVIIHTYLDNWTSLISHHHSDKLSFQLLLSIIKKKKFLRFERIFAPI